MTDPAAHRMFLWFDRAFWLIWPGFLLLIWELVREVRAMPAQLAALAPDQAACLTALPHVTTFSRLGQTVFWSAFGVEMLIYAALLAMVHRVVHRCATGQVFVAAMITSLAAIGWTIAAFPLVDLVLLNVSAWAYVQTGDMAVFAGTYALDVPVIGVGLLLVTMAAAMRMAVRLHRDAELTI